MSASLAIDRNRKVLLRLLKTLCAMVGMVDDCTVTTLPRGLRIAALQLLRPAEAAVRRLIVVLAQTLMRQGVYVAPSVPPAMPLEGIARGAGARISTFPLFDPRRRVGVSRIGSIAGPGPRIAVPGLIDPVFSPVDRALSASDFVDATRLCRRIARLQYALADLSKQARRLMRWRLKRALLPQGSAYKNPLRPGRPPGHRARPVHPVNLVLRDCHALALYASMPPDTS